MITIVSCCMHGRKWLAREVIMGELIELIQLGSLGSLGLRVSGTATRANHDQLWALLFSTATRKGTFGSFVFHENVKIFHPSHLNTISIIFSIERWICHLTLLRVRKSLEVKEKRANRVKVAKLATRFYSNQTWGQAGVIFSGRQRVAWNLQPNHNTINECLFCLFLVRIPCMNVIGLKVLPVAAVCEIKWYDAKICTWWKLT